MRLLIAVMIGATLLLGTPSGAFAQGRGDAGDRSQRGDSEEFRDTIRQERLKVPTAPSWQAPQTSGDEKPKQKNKKSVTDSNQVR